MNECDVAVCFDNGRVQHAADVVILAAKKYVRPLQKDVGILFV